MSDPATLAAGQAATKAADALIEHFDGCIILGSATDDDRFTVYVREVRGNRHAVEGAVREWLRTLDHYEAGYHAENGRQDAETHRRNREEPPETGDEWKAG